MAVDVLIVEFEHAKQKVEPLARIIPAYALYMITQEDGTHYKGDGIRFLGQNQLGITSGLTHYVTQATPESLLEAYQFFMPTINQEEALRHATESLNNWASVLDL